MNNFIVNPQTLTAEDVPASCKDLYELGSIIDQFIATESSDKFLEYFAQTRQIEYTLGYFAAIADCDNKTELATACRDQALKFKEYLQLQLGRNDFYKFLNSMRRLHTRYYGMGPQIYYDVLALSISYGGRLSGSDRGKLVELEGELDELCGQFMKNIAAFQQNPELIYVDACNITDPETIEWFKTHNTTDTTDTIYAIPMIGPNINKLLTLKCESIRIQTYAQAATRCQKSNEDVLRKIIKCRCRIASLLGYKSYNDLISCRRGHHNNATISMAEIKARVKSDYKHATGDFTDSIAQTYNHPMFMNDSMSGTTAGPITFPIDQMMEIAENMFGIKIWTDGGSQYYIDAGGVIGSVYFDLFARPGKVAQNMTYVGNYTDKIMAVTMNIYADSGTITYDDMQDFIHEIGHCLHIMAAEVIPFNCAFDCGRDIIEIPAMYAEAMFELKGPKLPVGDREVINAINQRQQYVLSEFDRVIHDFGLSTDFDALDLKQIWLDIENDTGVCAFAPCKPLFMFHHLAQAYAGWYYGYQLSRHIGRFRAVNESNEKGPILEIIRDMMNIRW